MRIAVKSRGPARTGGLRRILRHIRPTGSRPHRCEPARRRRTDSAAQTALRTGLPDRTAPDRSAARPPPRCRDEGRTTVPTERLRHSTRLRHPSRGSPLSASAGAGARGIFIRVSAPPLRSFPDRPCELLRPRHRPLSEPVSSASPHPNRRPFGTTGSTGISADRTAASVIPASPALLRPRRSRQKAGARCRPSRRQTQRSLRGRVRKPTTPRAQRNGTPLRPERTGADVESPAARPAGCETRPRPVYRTTVSERSGPTEMIFTGTPVSCSMNST